MLFLQLSWLLFGFVRGWKSKSDLLVSHTPPTPLSHPTQTPYPTTPLSCYCQSIYYNCPTKPVYSFFQEYKNRKSCGDQIWKLCFHSRNLLLRKKVKSPDLEFVHSFKKPMFPSCTVSVLIKPTYLCKYFALLICFLGGNHD